MKVLVIILLSVITLGAAGKLKLCQNGGAYSPIDNSCNCPVGYLGKLCDVNPCDVHNPCVNNGTCYPSEGGVGCSCPPNFPGIYCENIDCNFDEGYCTWKQSTSDIFDWTRDKGKASTPDSGPQYDHTGGGSYIYTEGSDPPREPGDTAIIESPELIQSTSSQCLSFWYHMYGEGMGVLNVYTKTHEKGLSDAVWKEAGDHGDAWRHSYVNLKPIPFSYSIVFEGVRGDYFDSDMAIDDVTLIEGVCPDIDCSFDESYCTWKQSSDDDFSWTRNIGATSTNRTGPHNDHTGDGSYIYINASAPQKPNDRARIESPEIIQSAFTRCLSFWYHMYGEDMGDLSVYIKTNRTGLGNVAWTRSGDQGNFWKHGFVNLPQVSFLYSIVFEGVRGSGRKSDIAIDDVTLIEGDCPEVNCNFDKSFCGWKQWSEDDFSWTRNKGATETDYTGPQNDHTGDGSYIYIEASYPREPNDRAIIESPEMIQPTSSQCLSFWYHMRGEDMGELNVYTKTHEKGLSDAVWTRAGDQGDDWRHSYVNLKPIPFSYSIVFEGVRGSDYASDIAIDDVTLAEGECPDF